MTVQQQVHVSQGPIAADPAIVNMVLTPYKDDCKYLKSVSVEFERVGRGRDSDNRIVARGEFSIPNSCYIADTGHFNAVEFNICYNQLSYCLFAESIRRGWLEFLADWNLEVFSQLQLSNYLIVRFQSSFKRPMEALRFEGWVSIDRVSQRKDTFFVTTTCGFSDERGGLSEGGALLAILAKEA